MKVINLYGGPCCGKSTVMAGLFWLMRCKGYNVEMAPEYIKEAVFERHDYMFKHQQLVFAQQLNKLEALESYGVDYAITDSPLLLSCVYGKNNSSEFNSHILQCYKHFDNINVILDRTFPYNRSGRVHKEKDARDIDRKCLLLLQSFTPRYTHFLSSIYAPEDILNWLKSRGDIELPTTNGDNM